MITGDRACARRFVHHRHSGVTVTMRVPRMQHRRRSDALQRKCNRNERSDDATENGQMSSSAKMRFRSEHCGRRKVQRPALRQRRELHIEASQPRARTAF